MHRQPSRDPLALQEPEKLSALARCLSGPPSKDGVRADVLGVLAAEAAPLAEADWLVIGALDPTCSSGPRVLASAGELHPGLGVGNLLRQTLELVAAHGPLSEVNEAGATFQDLGELAPEAFAAAPIVDGAGELVGVVAAFRRTPFEQVEVAREVLALVAARAETELHRQRADACLARRSRSAETHASIAIRLLHATGDGSMREVREALGTLGKLHGAELAGLLVLAGTPLGVDEVVAWRASDSAPDLSVLQGRRATELPWSERSFQYAEVAQGEWVGTRAGEAFDGSPRRLVAVPVVTGDTGGRWTAVMVLARTGPAWPEAELPELRIAAATLVGALRRERRDRRRRQRVERLRRQASAVVRLARSASPPEGTEFEHIAEMAAATLDVDLANIWLFNKKRSLLVHQASYVRGFGETTAADVHVADYPHYFEALFENRFIDADDARYDLRTSEFRDYYDRLGVRSTLDAAVRVEGHTVGVVCFEHCGAIRRWEEDEKGFAGTIADLVALAVEERERRHAAEALADRNRELEALNRIGEIAQEIGPLETIYGRIVQEVARATSFPVATIEFLDEARGKIVFEALTGASPPPGQVKVEIDADAMLPSARAIATGEQVVLSGAGMRPPHVEVQDSLAFILCTPLLVQGRAIGAMCLASPEVPSDVSSVRHLGRSVSRAVAGLIERRRAHEQEKLLEKQVAEAQRLEAVATLAGGIAHDFNNLMTGVMGYTALLKADSDPDGEVYQSAEMIESAAERAGELTQQLLSYGRRGKKRDIVFDAHRIAREVTTLIAPALPPGVELAVELAAETCTIQGDPGQLHQALMNLVVNARDALPRGGTIRVASRLLDAAELDDPELRTGRFLELSVEDTGCGIEPAVLHRIFEPFFTTKAPGQGTGMGLAMVYGIAADHGGTVRVESRIGVGTLFRLALPLHATRKLAERSANPVRGSGRVWIADDEAIVRGTASELLRSLGYVVDTFPDGVSLIEAFRRDGAEVDLVLLDIVMPEMDGRETLRVLRTLRADVRVLLTSGWDRVGAEGGALEDGALGFLPKPYQLDALADTVARAVRGERV